MRTMELENGRKIYKVKKTNNWLDKDHDRKIEDQSTKLVHCEKPLQKGRRKRRFISTSTFLNDTCFIGIVVKKCCPVPKNFRLFYYAPFISFSFRTFLSIQRNIWNTKSYYLFIKRKSIWFLFLWSIYCPIRGMVMAWQLGYGLTW